MNILFVCSTLCTPRQRRRLRRSGMGVYESDFGSTVEITKKKKQKEIRHQGNQPARSSWLAMRRHGSGDAILVPRGRRYCWPKLAFNVIFCGLEIFFLPTHRNGFYVPIFIAFTAARVGKSSSSDGIVPVGSNGDAGSSVEWGFQGYWGAVRLSGWLDDELVGLTLNIDWRGASNGAEVDDDWCSTLK